MYRDINKMEDGCRFWFEDMFHLPDHVIVATQHSYTFSSFNVPYSVGEKSVRKIVIVKNDLVGGNI